MCVGEFCFSLCRVFCYFVYDLFICIAMMFMFALHLSLFIYRFSAGGLLLCLWVCERMCVCVCFFGMCVSVFVSCV